MLIDNIMNYIVKIGVCTKEEFEIKVLKAFSGYYKEEVFLSKGGSNLYIVHHHDFDIPILSICVEEEDGNIKVIDAWN